ncbi:uncharacterized protein LOC113345870 [Papaver somniferum]|uniref:uncharacterized protein LOC113345870 n=1 Tax=Papaver somniferum TaxID=3469 RepID=UPI000E700C18|nr:uncharacterized protein LOC113345870 [Papaver somniferum]
MAQRLPKFIIIQSNFNHRYLHLEKVNPTAADSLRFDGDYSFGLETRFEVVPATTENGLVHIRSKLNDRFWANMGGPNGWITATSVKPDENRSSQSCTLFQPVYLNSNSNKIVRLLHVHTSYYVSFFMGTNQTNGCLNLISNSQLTDQRDLFTIIDWQSIVMFPDIIRIKGDNGMHLKAFSDGLWIIIMKSLILQILNMRCFQVVTEALPESVQYGNIGSLTIIVVGMGI